MEIQVNNKLTVSRNPTEHGFELNNHKGSVVHRIDDGFNLIEFKQFQIKQYITIKKKKVMVFVNLQWYIHNNDLKILK